MSVSVFWLKLLYVLHHTPKEVNLHLWMPPWESISLFCIINLAYTTVLYFKLVALQKYILQICTTAKDISYFNEILVLKFYWCFQSVNMIFEQVFPLPMHTVPGDTLSQCIGILMQYREISFDERQLAWQVCNLDLCSFSWQYLQVKWKLSSHITFQRWYLVYLFIFSFWGEPSLMCCSKNKIKTKLSVWYAF